MPQNPLFPTPGGTARSLNITAATTLKASPGTLWQVQVVVAGSAAGSVNDCATVGAVAASNKNLTLPNTVGPVNQQPFPCKTGITVTPGTGQTLAVSWS